MKKILIPLGILIIMSACSTSNDSSTENGNIIDYELSFETILEELQASSLWHLDYMEHIDEFPSFTSIDWLMRFNDNGTMNKLLEGWFLRYPNSQNLDCYSYYFSVNGSWSIKRDTETELILDDGNDTSIEQGRHVFTKEGNVIMYEYKEWHNGILLVPGQPIIKMTASNIEPENDLYLCE
jgi:hypothetical protein